ncbi:M23 family metallopeptidase [Aquibacillus sediminis]|uniref:M23 family metallopeptidase n=1 Tax=Aquibacillus sediminis TaxID=2574734 RepID=UPI001FEBCCDD|nr:M23 family metallopeptidase [Aquibacillus sediminis]
MWKKQVDEYTSETHRELNKKPMQLFKKLTIPTMLSLGLMVSVVQADSNKELSTIYHVYIDDNHIGTVDDKDIVRANVDQMIQDYEKENQDKSYSYTIGEEITYVSEKVFEPSAMNQEVVDLLEDELSVQVDAYGLKIGDQTVGYFKDKETAEKTLDRFKAKYVDLQEIENIEQQGRSIASQSLSVGESNIIDVELSEKVTVSKEKAPEKDLLTEEDGMELLEKGTLTDQIHEVEKGEVLGRIASDYDLDMDTILELNPSLEEDSVLQIDQEINVTDYASYLDVIVTIEKLEEEEIDYEKEVEYSDELYKGDTKVKQQGQKGSKKVHYSIEEVNGNVESKEVVDSEVTKQPVKEIVVHGTKVISSRGTGEFRWPTVGGRVTSHVGPRWGRMHKGIDIAGVSDPTIMAADNGVVVSAGHDGSYGNKVVVDHNNGYKSIYAHLSSISVNVGQTVQKGKKLGVMGSTGRSTGTHLHFEVYKNGGLLNPLDLY